MSDIMSEDLIPDCHPDCQWCHRALDRAALIEGQRVCLSCRLEAKEQEERDNEQAEYHDQEEDKR